MTPTQALIEAAEKAVHEFNEIVEWNKFETFPLRDQELQSIATRIAALKAAISSAKAAEGGNGWIDVKQELPPVNVWVLGWLFLPKNPPASGCSIAQYTGCERDEPESYGRVRMTVDCWWANGIYYPSGHFTHWQPLPAPPETREKG